MPRRKNNLDLKSIDDLNPASYNPRSIGSEAAAGLVESLKRFGDISGIVWNAETGNLVSGHQRVDRLREQGAVLKNGALELPDGRRWPVRVVTWSLIHEKAANITANNPSVAGEFTPDVGDILGELEEQLEEDLFAGLRLGDIEIPEIESTDDQNVEVEEWDIGDEEVNAWFVVRCSLGLATDVKSHLDDLPDGVTLDSSV